MKEDNKRIEDLKRDLFSTDEAVVVSALSKCRETGNHNLVLPLINLFAASESALVKENVADILSNLKVTRTESPFLEALQEDSLRAVRRDVLHFMWNSGLQPTDRLTELVELTVRSEFEEILECLTLIESMDGPFAEEQIEESSYILREWIAGHSNDDSLTLMVEFLKVVEDLPVSY